MTPPPRKKPETSQLNNPCHVDTYPMSSLDNHLLYTDEKYGDCQISSPEELPVTALDEKEHTNISEASNNTLMKTNKISLLLKNYFSAWKDAVQMSVIESLLVDCRKCAKEELNTTLIKAEKDMQFRVSEIEDAHVVAFEKLKEYTQVEMQKKMKDVHKKHEIQLQTEREEEISNMHKQLLDIETQHNIDLQNVQKEAYADMHKKLNEREKEFKIQMKNAQLKRDSKVIFPVKKTGCKMAFFLMRIMIVKKSADARGKAWAFQRLIAETIGHRREVTLNKWEHDRVVAMQFHAEYTTKLKEAERKLALALNTNDNVDEESLGILDRSAGSVAVDNIQLRQRLHTEAENAEKREEEFLTKLAVLQAELQCSRSLTNQNASNIEDSNCQPKFCNSPMTVLRNINNKYNITEEIVSCSDSKTSLREFGRILFDEKLRKTQQDEENILDDEENILDDDDWMEGETTLAEIQ